MFENSALSTSSSTRCPLMTMAMMRLYGRPGGGRGKLAGRGGGGGGSRGGGFDGLEHRVARGLVALGAEVDLVRGPQAGIERRFRGPGAAESLRDVGQADVRFLRHVANGLLQFGRLLPAVVGGTSGHQE